jgi:drug/metabolite transporter (DMT)-like permease
MLRGVIWSGVGLAIFSGWFVVTRLVMTGDLRVWDVVALRFGGGTIVLLPVLLTQGRRLPRSAWREGLQLAFLWGAPFVLCVALGLRLTSAADASSITPGLMPIFAGLFAWMAFGERPAKLRVAGYAVILVGTATLVYGSFTGGTGLSVTGLAALVIAAAMWALYTVRFRHSTLTSLQATAFICFWSAVIYLPVYVLSGVSELPHAPFREIAFQSIYQGGLMSGLAIFAFNRAVALLGPTAASSIIALVPVVATAAAAPVLGEIPSALACAAISVTACGVALAAGMRGRPAAIHAAAAQPTSA